MHGSIVDMDAKRPPRQPLWLDGTSIEPKPTDWLWYPYIAAEHINIIAGMGNEGKGLVCTHIAACVTRGRAFPLCAEKHPPGDVLWLEMEDGIEDTVVPRMLAAGVDMNRVRILNRREFIKISNISHIDTIADAIREYKPRLVVLSPMNSFLGDINLNSETEVRAAFDRMRDPTEGLGTVILGIAHANKKSELSAIERVSGSVAYVNYCRCVILVTNEVDETRRFINGKWNKSKHGPDLLYTAYYNGDDPRKRDQYVRVRWDTALNDVDHRKAFVQESDTEREKEKAPQWLERTLQEKGVVSISDLKDACQKAGFKWRAVEVARQRINERHGDYTIGSMDGNWSLNKNNSDA